MYRSAGTGLVGLGIVLVVVGAILKFAVTVSTTGFNINAVGIILLIVGIIAALVGVAMFAMSQQRHVYTREDVRATPDGQERIMEQRGSGA